MTESNPPNKKSEQELRSLVDVTLMERLFLALGIQSIIEFVEIILPPIATY